MNIEFNSFFFVVFPYVHVQRARCWEFLLVRRVNFFTHVYTNMAKMNKIKLF